MISITTNGDNVEIMYEGNFFELRDEVSLSCSHLFLEFYADLQEKENISLNEARFAILGLLLEISSIVSARLELVDVSSQDLSESHKKKIMSDFIGAFKELSILCE